MTNPGREARDIVSLWIKSHQTLKKHPKICRLTKILGINIPQAIGHLHCLWWWAMDYAKDGDISAFDEVDIAIAAEWEHDPQTLVDALLNCGPGGSSGFLERDEKGLRIHDWKDYSGKLIEAASEKKAKAVKTRAVASNMEEVERWWSAFWENYPRRMDKKRARAAFDATITNAPESKKRDRMQKISLRLAKYCQECEGKEEKYIRYPSTWLRGYDWDDELEDGEIIVEESYDLEPRGDYGSLRDDDND